MGSKTNRFTYKLAQATIRKGTEHELEDAFALAQFLAEARDSLDSITFEFSSDLFVAISLCIAHSDPEATLHDVLNQLLDPGWDCGMQMLLYFSEQCQKFPVHKDSLHWLAGFSEKVQRLDKRRAEHLVRRCHDHWKKSMSIVSAMPAPGSAKRKVRPRRSVQLFSPGKVQSAMEQLCELSQEKRAGGERVLGNALLNDGFRQLPDAKRASKELESAKAVFENLEAPLGRLQLDLVLSGAMPPNEFHITPILLLGDPGVGKTYLASQLADALGVDMQKLSAGGAQGAFQLNGSQSSWSNAKYGSIVELLACGRSCSPVVVIDEVDKIGSSQSYPVLPALLDLLETRSAMNFKDEFLGLEFDCSKIIFILTANSISDVPMPLQSRVNVFDVPRPEPEQRLRIIQNEIKQWQKKTRRNQINFEPDGCHRLAERVDLDLRKTTDLVREGFARALCSKSSVAKLAIPADKSRTIGF